MQMEAVWPLASLISSQELKEPLSFAIIPANYLTFYTRMGPANHLVKFNSKQGLKAQTSSVTILAQPRSSCIQMGPVCQLAK